MESSDNTLRPSPTPPWRRPRLLIVALILFVVGSLGTLWAIIPPVWHLDGGTVTVTHWHRTKGKEELTIGPGEPRWIATSKISKHALHAIVAAEDARFYRHSGLDFIEIWESIKTNIEEGRYARGASTITQQVVKVAFLTREKTLWRKFREALGAVLLEQLLPKHRILEWYINLVEFGDGVYGIKEGCWHYFKTKPAQLTIQQSVHLALVLPSPNRWSKGLRAKRLTDFGHRRFKYILRRMRRMDFITEEQWRSSLATGDFGRPLHGYQELLAEGEEEGFCEDSDCPEVTEDLWDADTDDLIFPPRDEPVKLQTPVKPQSLPFSSPATETISQSPVKGGSKGARTLKELLKASLPPVSPVSSPVEPDDQQSVSEGESP